VVSTDTLPAEHAAAKPNPTEALALTIASIVERQLTKFAATVNSQMDDIRQHLAAQQQHFDAYQQAMQTAVEDRLAALAGHQQMQHDDLDARLKAIPQRLQAEMPLHLHAATQSLAAQSTEQHATVVAELDAIRATVDQLEAQSATIIQHVNDTTTTLVQRVDDGDAAIAHAVEERLSVVKEMLDNIEPEVQRLVGEHAASLISKMEYVESTTTDRMLEMESRINEQQGTRMAQLEATIGRIGSGFDDSIMALNQRMLDMDTRLVEGGDRLDALAEQVAGFDQAAFDSLKEQVSSAVGEAMLVRIEMDRATGATKEQLDKQAIRMAEIEAQLEDEMDVSAAVQLERLDELERALLALDPSQFVRKSDQSGTPPAPNHTAPVAPATPVAPTTALGDDAPMLGSAPTLPDTTIPTLSAQ
jgi:hypothetical protein